MRHWMKFCGLACGGLLTLQSWGQESLLMCPEPTQEMSCTQIHLAPSKDGMGWPLNASQPMQAWVLSSTEKKDGLMGVFLSGINPQVVKGQPLQAPRFMYDQLALQWQQVHATQGGLLLIPTAAAQKAQEPPNPLFSIPRFVEEAMQRLGGSPDSTTTSSRPLVVMAHSAGGNILTTSLETLHSSLRVALWLDGVNGPQEGKLLATSLQRILTQQVQQLEACAPQEQANACFQATLNRQPVFLWYYTSSYEKHHLPLRRQLIRSVRDLAAQYPQTPTWALQALQGHYHFVPKEGVSHSDLMRSGAVREALQIAFAAFPQS